MKKIVFLTLLLTLSSALMAQYKEFQLGFKASPTLSWLNANDIALKGDAPQVGFTGGFVAEINFTENYMILTGINYNYSRGKMSYQGINPTTDTTSLFYQHIADIKQSVQFQYVEVPVAVKLRTNELGRFRIYGSMGLNTAFCFNAKSDKVYTIDKESVETQKENVKNDFTLVKESLLLGLGTDIKIDRSSFLSVGVNFNTALNNLAKFKYYHEGNERQAKFTLSYVELNIAFIF